MARLEITVKSMALRHAVLALDLLMSQGDTDPEGLLHGEATSHRECEFRALLAGYCLIAGCDRASGLQVIAGRRADLAVARTELLANWDTTCEGGYEHQTAINERSRLLAKYADVCGSLGIPAEAARLGAQALHVYNCEGCHKKFN